MKDDNVYTYHRVLMCGSKRCGSVQLTKIGFVMFPLFFSRNMDISSRDIRKLIRDGFIHLESVNRSFGRNGCCHRKGLACDVSLRLTRAIMVGKTSLVRVCACLKERQRTSELMSIIFPFLFLAQLSYGGKRQRFFSNAEVKSHKMQIRLSAAVTLDSKMQTL